MRACWRRVEIRVEINVESTPCQGCRTVFILRMYDEITSMVILLNMKNDFFRYKRSVALMHLTSINISTF